MTTLALQNVHKTVGNACVAAFFLVMSACGGSGGDISALPAQTGILADDAVPALAVTIDTNFGDIVVELDADKAPLTVENFLNYVDSSHYDGTIFHRVIEGFVIQGGGFTDDYSQKETLDPVANEADNGLKNSRYTISMARTADPQSATAQFFINVEDNTFLDYRAPTGAGWGYTVFGEVTSGTDVVDQIESLATGAGGVFVKDVPLQAVRINSITRVVR